MNWISIEERNPEETGFYQVYIETDSGRKIHGFWWDGKNWRFDNDVYPGEPLFTAGYHVAVTHWMPRPETPHLTNP